MFPAGGIRLFRAFGIPVFLSYYWFIIIFVMLNLRQGYYENSSWIIAECLSLFGIVLLHEFGHALACLSVGGKVDRILITPLGGLAYTRPPQKPGLVLWTVAAGPMVNFVIFIAALPLLNIPHNNDLHKFAYAIVWENKWLLILNLLPVYPLDGGKILRCLLWFIFGSIPSLMIAAVLGMLCAAGVFVLILRFNSMQGDEGSVDYWDLLLAVWLGMGAWNGMRAALAMRRYESLPRHAEFHCPACGKPPLAGARWRCSRCATPFDTFERHAVCPRCGHIHDITICPDCGASSPMAAWNRLPQNVSNLNNFPVIPVGAQMPPQPPPGAPEIQMPGSGNPTG